MNSVDPKFRKWQTIQKEFRKLETDECVNLSRRSDSSLCLTHGFHYQNSYMCKDIIRCLAYRSNAVTEEFIINYGHGTGHVIEIKSFKKDSLRYDGDEVRPTTEQSIIHLTTPPLQHMVWLHKHRLFVGIGNDKNLRVYSDIVNRCRALSAPTVCAMPVLCMTYLEETDEVITAGIGVIQPWKIRFATDMQLDRPESDKKRAKSESVHGGIPQTDQREFGQGRQMLQPCEPYRCDVMKDEWVLKLKVYNDKKNKYSITEGCKTVLVATSAEVIVAIDYIKRKQLWSARLLSTYSIVTEMDRMDKDVTGEPKVKPPTANYIIRGHVSLTACDFFPRYGYLITGGIEGMIQVMHMVNFRSVATLIGHRLAITGVVAHTRYPFVISSSADKSIRIWCLETFRENQRIDTVHRIQSISLSDNRRFLFYQTKKRISMYYFHNHYSLYSIPHSTAASLCPVRGDNSRGKYGKILAGLADGSVALLSPSTGMMITMIYPMTTFQIFDNMVFDIYSGMCYIHLQNGSLLQCDCNTNPSIPMQRLVPSLSFDEDVCSIAAVCVVHTKRQRSVTVVMAGLRNGQIVLVRPNDYWMSNVQAHESEVRFLKTASDALSSQGNEEYSRDLLLSISDYSVRIWRIVVSNFSELPRNDKNAHHHGKIAVKLFQLQPLKKLFLPTQALRPNFVAVLDDRVCVSGPDGQITVVESDERGKSAIPENEYIQYYQGNEEVKKASMNTEHSRFYSQNKEDRHTGKITALSSSLTLRFFASACDGGFVKLWDDRNRLLRELSFLPNCIKAICFVNERDLLVSLEGRILAVECSTYLTKQIIVQRKIADLDFVDLRCQEAHPYNNDVTVVSTIEMLCTAPLCANQRTRLKDCALEERARNAINEKREEYTECTAAESETASSRQNDYRKGFEAAMIDHKRYTDDKRSSMLSIGARARKEAYRRMCTRVRRKSTASLFDEDAAATAIIRREKQVSTTRDNAVTSVLEEETEIEQGVSRESLHSTKLMTHNRNPEEILSSGDHLERATQHARLTIPSYGYIPNSVVRKKAKPPSATLEIQAKMWKCMSRSTGLQNAEDDHWFKWNNFDDDSEWVPEEYSSESEASHSQHAMALLTNNSNYALLQQYYAQQDEDSDILTDDEKDIEKRKARAINPGFPKGGYMIEFDEENRSAPIDPDKIMKAMATKDLQQYQKYFEKNRGRSSSARISFRKLGNTLQNDSNEGAADAPRRKGERVLKFRPIARAAYAMHEKGKGRHKNASEGLSQTSDGSSYADSGSSKSKSDTGEEGSAAAGEETEPNQRHRSSSVSIYRTSSDMKAKLMQQRSEAKELAQSRTQIATVHPLLEKISTSPWFRRRLSDVNAETVANTLLEVGNTTRTVGQQKACEDLTLLVKEFGPENTDRQLREILSNGVLDRINVFVASYLNPQYSLTTLTGVGDESIISDEDKKRNVNRVKLAHNAMDCIENDIGMSKEIELGLIRLAADVNHELRARALRLLEYKMGISSLDDLTQRLTQILERDIVLRPVSTTKFQDEALEDVLQKVKKGSFALEQAPKMAERLNLVIAKRRLSGLDEENDETVNEGEKQFQTATEVVTTKTSETNYRRLEDKSSDKPGPIRPIEGENGDTMDDNAAETKCDIAIPDTDKKKDFEQSHDNNEITKNVKQDKATRSSKSGSRRIRQKRSGGVPNTKFPKINWKRAIPKPSKHIIKTMRTMRLVHRMARLNKAGNPKMNMQRPNNEHNLRAPKTSEKSYSPTDEAFGSFSTRQSPTQARTNSQTEITLSTIPEEPNAQSSIDGWRSTLKKLKDYRGSDESPCTNSSSKSKHSVVNVANTNPESMNSDEKSGAKRVTPIRHNRGGFNSLSGVDGSRPLRQIRRLRHKKYGVGTKFRSVSSPNHWEDRIPGPKPHEYSDEQLDFHEESRGTKYYLKRRSKDVSSVYPPGTKHGQLVHEESKSITYYLNRRVGDISPTRQQIKPGHAENVPAPPPSVMQKADHWESQPLRKTKYEKRRSKMSLYHIGSKSFKKLMVIAQEHYREVLVMKEKKSESRHGSPPISIRMPSICSSSNIRRNRINDRFI